MAIAQSELLRAGQRRPLMKSQIRPGLQKTAFLCHSHRDSALAEGLQALLAEQGVALYIDWQDATMPPGAQPRDSSTTAATHQSQRLVPVSRNCQFDGVALVPLGARVCRRPEAAGSYCHRADIRWQVSAWQ